MKRVTGIGGVFFKSKDSAKTKEWYDKHLGIESGEHDAVYPGRVTDYLRSVNHLPEDYKYYLCGRAEMVVEARDILIEKGIPFSSIVSEIYI